MPYTMAMRALTITAIVLVAVIMVIGAVAPAIPLAHAGHPCGEIGRAGHTCIPQEPPITPPAQACEKIRAALESAGIDDDEIAAFLELIGCP